MIHFQAAGETERAQYGDEFDRVIVFKDKAIMRAIHLAAWGHIRSVESVGEVASGFFRGVLSVDPATESMMMNPSFVADYSNLLLGYANIGYLYADNEEDLDVDVCRDRAKLFSDTMVYESHVFDRSQGAEVG
jgi:hypothetical protein